MRATAEQSVPPERKVTLTSRALAISCSRRLRSWTSQEAARLRQSPSRPDHLPQHRLAPAEPTELHRSQVQRQAACKWQDKTGSTRTQATPDQLRRMTGKSAHLQLLYEPQPLCLVGPAVRRLAQQLHSMAAQHPGTLANLRGCNTGTSIKFDRGSLKCSCAASPPIAASVAMFPNAGRRPCQMQSYQCEEEARSSPHHGAKI